MDGLVISLSFLLTRGFLAFDFELGSDGAALGGSIAEGARAAAALVTLVGAADFDAAARVVAALLVAIVVEKREWISRVQFNYM